MLIKLLEGQWINTDQIECIAEETSGNTQVFKATYVHMARECSFYTTKERADDLAKRINSPEHMQSSRLTPNPIEVGP